MPTGHKQFWIGSVCLALIALAITSGEEWRLTLASGFFFALAACVLLWGLFGERFVGPRLPSRHDWLEQERRFGLIEDELEAIGSVYSTGLVTWSVHPSSAAGSASSRIPYRPKHPDRSKKRFEQEAEHAGQLLRRVGYVVPGFPMAADTDGFDYWMSAIFAHVPKESDISGDGIDRIGRSTSVHIANVVDGSKLLCALMAKCSG